MDHCTLPPRPVYEPGGTHPTGVPTTISHLLPQVNQSELRSPLGVPHKSDAVWVHDTQDPTTHP